MNIALTGSSGFVGSHVLAELVAHGHEVTALVRERRGSDSRRRQRCQGDRRRSVRPSRRRERVGEHGRIDPHGESRRRHERGPRFRHRRCCDRGVFRKWQAPHSDQRSLGLRSQHRHHRRLSPQPATDGGVERADRTASAQCGRSKSNRPGLGLRLRRRRRRDPRTASWLSTRRRWKSDHDRRRTAALGDGARRGPGRLLPPCSRAGVGSWLLRDRERADPDGRRTHSGCRHRRRCTGRRSRVRGRGALASRRLLRGGAPPRPGHPGDQGSRRARLEAHPSRTRSRSSSLAAAGSKVPYLALPSTPDAVQRAELPPCQGEYRWHAPDGALGVMVTSHS